MFGLYVKSSICTFFNTYIFFSLIYLLFISFFTLLVYVDCQFLIAQVIFFHFLVYVQKTLSPLSLRLREHRNHVKY